jgi:general secretion pathway protein B
MSYILDALKKADRERALKRVPTVTTVHVPVAGRMRRLGLWMAGGVLLLGGGMALWLLRPSSGVVLPTPADSRTDAQVSRPSGRANPEQTGDPVVTQGGDRSAAGLAQQSPRQSGRESPLPSRPKVVLPLPSPGPGDFEEMRPGGRPPDRARSVGVMPVETPPGESKLDGGRPGLPEPGERSPHQESRPGPGSDGAKVDGERPSALSAPPTVPALGDAIGKMTLDVFVYADAEADRMVVINGRRYMKGQRVDGQYLVEDITPEGVILSFQGARALLQP